MFLPINISSNGKRLPIAFFNLIVQTKVNVNSSQVVVTCRYVTMVFTINLFSTLSILFLCFQPILNC